MNATEGTGADEPAGEAAGLAAMTADVDTGVDDVRAEGDCGDEEAHDVEDMVATYAGHMSPVRAGPA